MRGRTKLELNREVDGDVYDILTVSTELDDYQAGSAKLEFDNAEIPWLGLQLRYVLENDKHKIEPSVYFGPGLAPQPYGPTFYQRENPLQLGDPLPGHDTPLYTTKDARPKLTSNWPEPGKIKLEDVARDDFVMLWEVARELAAEIERKLKTRRRHRAQAPKL